MNDSTDRIFGKATETPKPSHAESFAKKSAKTGGVNRGNIGKEIAFIDASGNEEGGFFRNVQYFKCNNENKLLRIFFLHGIVDIETNNASALRKIFYKHKYTEFKAGETYDEIEVIAIDFYSVDNMPAIP